MIAVIVAMMVSSFVTNPRWNFSFAFEIMNQSPVLDGLWKGTILGTVGAMVLGVGLGIPLAVMRLSGNPVLRGVAFVYTWFFRAMPRYVLLAIIGGLAVLYHQIDIGIPFGQQLAGARPRHDLTFFSFSWNDFSTVDLDRHPRSRALRGRLHGRDRPRRHPVGRPGPGRGGPRARHEHGKTMRRIVLPQAMRVIVPPTGNETIAMVKDTSLFIAASIITELYFQTYGFGSRTFQIMPGFMAATLWYLIICSILMVGQYYLERYFGRGFGAPAKATRRSSTRSGGH